jgi:formate hydrogenlyase subunit 6/NADH:ubiquinone oxidoreductase subunit I
VPYSAIKFRNEPGNPVPVPEVLEERCSGCGFCEHHCPVQNQSAIYVTPMGAVRLNKGSFMEYGKSQGLNISLEHKGKKEQAGATGYPGESYPGIEEGGATGFEDSAPGFDTGTENPEVDSPAPHEDSETGIAPGFTE